MSDRLKKAGMFSTDSNFCFSTRVREVAKQSVAIRAIASLWSMLDLLGVVLAMVGWMVDIVLGVVQVVADGGGWSHSTDGGTGAPGPQNCHSLVLAVSTTRVKPNVSVQASQSISA
jgi:hypothetical protein